MNLRPYSHVHICEGEELIIFETGREKPPVVAKLPQRWMAERITEYLNLFNELTLEEIRSLVPIAKSVPMLLHCPICAGRHLDEGEFATKPHHTHACQHCGHCWRPAVCNTVGVKFLPGFKNGD